MILDCNFHCTVTAVSFWKKTMSLASFVWTLLVAVSLNWSLVIIITDINVTEDETPSNILHMLYTMTFTPLGHSAVIQVLTYQDNISVLLPFVTLSGIENYSFLSANMKCFESLIHYILKDLPIYLLHSQFIFNFTFFVTLWYWLCTWRWFIYQIQTSTHTNFSPFSPDSCPSWNSHCLFYKQTYWFL